MQRVLILGAGFGGLELATMLSEAVAAEVDVALIDKNDAFVFGYSKLDVMFGRTSGRRCPSPVPRDREARRALSAGDDHRDRSRSAPRNDRRRRPRGRRPGRRARRRLRRRRDAGARRRRKRVLLRRGRGAVGGAAARFLEGQRGHRRLRRAVQMPARAERGGAACCTTTSRRAASATPARSRL